MKKGLLNLRVKWLGKNEIVAGDYRIVPCRGFHDMRYNNRHQMARVSRRTAMAICPAKEKPSVIYMSGLQEDGTHRTFLEDMRPFANNIDIKDSFFTSTAKQATTLLLPTKKAIELALSLLPK